MKVLENILQRAKNLATASIGLAKLAVGTYDATQVSDATYEQRIAKCKECPNYKSATNQCKACGCFLSIKARLMYDPVVQQRTGEKTETVCPDGKW